MKKSTYEIFQTQGELPLQLHQNQHKRVSEITLIFRKNKKSAQISNIERIYISKLIKD